MKDAHIAESALLCGRHNARSRCRKNSDPGPCALLAVYDFVTGGTFASVYSGANFLRIWSHQPLFVHYARSTTATSPDKEVIADSPRLPTSIIAGPPTLSPASRKNREQHKIDLLEKVFQQAFVETDYEIAVAVRGKLHPEANTPYHPSTTTSTETGTGHR